MGKIRKKDRKDDSNENLKSKEKGSRKSTGKRE